MSKQQTRYRHQRKKELFCSIKSIRSLCTLLRIDQRRLLLMAKQPKYKVFNIPKKGGGERTIEAPAPDLKKVLSILNGYLQSTYYFEKSKAAHGFILGVKNDEDRRNVLTNAKKHLGKAYLLNVDLKNFFHTVTREKVLQIFIGKPFKFKRNLPDVLADLVTYQGRLPMGTPTSPVLSNFACRELDQVLVQFSQEMLWAYSRYADDLSFSSNQMIAAEKVNSIRRIIKQQAFVINERKLKIYGPEEQKIVTGLLVSKGKVELAPDYLPQLKAEIQHLNSVFRVQNEQGQLSTKWVQEFKMQVRGRLNFTGFVLKRNHPDYIQLKDDFITAINPPEEEFGAISWRGFPYNF